MYEYNQSINISNCKEINIEYLDDYISLKVPANCETLKLKPTPALANVKQAIDNAFENPINSKTIDEIIGSHAKSVDELTVAIAVSDNTRPVPYHYKDDGNILSPILERLERVGVKRENIKIIIGAGTHAPTSLKWKNSAFGEEVVESYQFIDHDCYSKDLIPMGDVMGIPVRLSKDFINSDIHIVTGLVETHFMAGASGGRKAVCPGMVNIEATQVFHGPEFMANENADNLVFKDNPCHEFALEVARRAKIDYTVNVLINGDHQVCGIYTGALEDSHKEAVNQLKSFSLVNTGKDYDIILTHGGKGAVNHYQSIKGAWGAQPVLKQNGDIILLAHNQDEESIGSQYYKDLMKMFMEVGLGNFYPLISSKDWNFTHDQWEVQKWDQFFTRIGGFEHLIYCTVNIPKDVLDALPGINGYKFIKDSKEDISTMLQNAIYYCVSKKKNPSMAFIKEGPYVVLKK